MGIDCEHALKQELQDVDKLHGKLREAATDRAIPPPTRKELEAWKQELYPTLLARLAGPVQEAVPEVWLHRLSRLTFAATVTTHPQAGGPER